MTEQTAMDLNPTAPAADQTTATPDTSTDLPSAGGGAPDPLAEALSKTYDEIHAPDEPATETNDVDQANQDATNSEDQPSDADPAQQPDTDQPADKDGEPTEHGHAPEAITVPNSWSAEARENWDKIPPEAQKYIAERESEAHKTISEQGMALSTYEPIRQAFQRFPQYQNLNQAQFTANLVATAAAMDADPVAGLKHLAKTYKVDLGQLAGQTNTNADDVDDYFHDPRVDPLKQELDQTKQQLQQLTGHLTTQQQAQQTAVLNEANETINKVAAEKPYFNELQEDILREIDVVKTSGENLTMNQILDKAYDRAVRLNDVVSAKIAQDRKAKDDAEAQKAAAKARAQAQTNIKSTNNATPKPNGSWEDGLGAIYDGLQAG